MDPWHTEIKNVSMRIWEEMRWRCNVGTWKADSRMNKDEGRRPQKHSSTYIVSHVVCVERGREEDMVLFFECVPMPFICKVVRKWDICGWPRGGIFSRGQAGTGVADSLGSVHQSRNSCEQCWCKRRGWKGQLWAVVSPSQSPPPPPLKMCHLNKLTSVSGSILPGVARGLWKGCRT